MSTIALHAIPLRSQRWLEDKAPAGECESEFDNAFYSYLDGTFTIGKE